MSSSEHVNKVPDNLKGFSADQLLMAAKVIEALHTQPRAEVAEISGTLRSAAESILQENAKPQISRNEFRVKRLEMGLRQIAERGGEQSLAAAKAAIQEFFNTYPTLKPSPAEAEQMLSFASTRLVRAADGSWEVRHTVMAGRAPYRIDIVKNPNTSEKALVTMDMYA